MSIAIPTSRDKCRGAMLATAIGDALGWPNESRSKNKSKSSNSSNGFVAWIRRNNKPCYHDERILPGEYSDDTQLTLSVARSIITGNWEKFFSEKELVFWLRYERGGGRALLNAAKSYESGTLPWQSKYASDYFNAGGNGTVMRILPHVISYEKKNLLTDLMIDIIKDSIITHGHPRAILGATCYAFALDYLLRKNSVLGYGELVSAIIDGEKIWGAYPDETIFYEWLSSANQYFNYRKVWTDTLSEMHTQLNFIRASLKKGLILDDSKILTQLGCFSTISGAGDVAILAALYLASRYANNPLLGIKIPASSPGLDTDTIASITGGLLGMLCGTEWIPVELKFVQDYDCFNRITDILLSDDSKQAAKMELLDTNGPPSDWINTMIGRVRQLESVTVENGKYAIVTIKKWQSVLGQTFYTKEMQRLPPQSTYPSLKDSLPDQQVRLDSMMSETKTISDYQNFTKERTIQDAYSTDRQFVLSSSSIELLLNNPNFKKSITIGKVLKIISSILEGNKATSSIAKKFNVPQEVVEMINSCIQQR